MTDLFLPEVRVASATPKLLDNTGRFSSPLSGTVRTVARPGDRWGVRLDYQNLFGFERARMESFIARMRGAANRVLYTPRDFPQRGSFPSGEKFLNNNFAAGTNGWTVGAGGSLTVADRRARVTFNGSGVASLTQVVANLTVNLPHVARYFLVDGKGSPLGAGVLDCWIEGTGAVTNNAVSFEGLNVLALVPDAASGSELPFTSTGGTNIPTGQIAGNYVEAVWTSLSQCMLVDNGPNGLEFSDTFASPWTGSAMTVTANSVVAADATTTAAALKDTTANSNHSFSQGSLTVASGADYMVCGEFKAGAVNFLWLELQENTGSTVAGNFFNLSAGTVGSAITTGANWANPRSFIAPLGNGWFYCCFIARKTNAAGTGTVIVGSASANGTQAYTGTGGTAINARRLTFSQSSVPALQIQSSSAPVAAAAQTGSAYFVKGLPASSSGLLLPGDWVDIGQELKRVTAQLDSDAAGRGYLQFSPPIRTSAADNAPVAVNSPFGRFILSSNDNGWQAVPGPNAQPFGNLSLDLIEASA